MRLVALLMLLVIPVAEELANHLEEMSGAKLPIVTDAEHLPRHAILLGRPRLSGQAERLA